MTVFIGQNTLIIDNFYFSFVNDNQYLTKAQLIARKLKLQYFFIIQYFLQKMFLDRLKAD